MTIATDEPFAAFGLTARPWIDLDALREDFARKSADLHPDKHQGKPAAELAEIQQRYTALNQAFQTLREPKERLLHLFEKTKGAKPCDVQRIPPGTMNLFVEVGQLCQKIDEHLKAAPKASSALEKAGVMVAGLDLQEALSAMEQKLSHYAKTLETELTALDAQWIAGDKKLDALETLYRKYSYVWRWQQQLQERLVALLT